MLDDSGLAGILSAPRDSETSFPPRSKREPQLRCIGRVSPPLLSGSVPAEAAPGGGGEPRSEGLCGPRGGAGLRGRSGPGGAAQEVI